MCIDWPAEDVERHSIRNGLGQSKLADKGKVLFASRHYTLCLDYSRIEFAADARHRVCGCGSSLQMPRNEAGAVKSARPKGKLCRHIIRRNAFETDGMLF